MGVYENLFVRLIFFGPAILHGVGTFSGNWIEDVDCRTTDNKLSCCDHDSVDDRCHGAIGVFDIRASIAAIQVVVFILLTLTALGLFLYTWLVQGEVSEDCFNCCFVMMPIEGLLVLGSCLAVPITFRGETLGRSFYKCLGAGFWIICYSALLCLCECFCKKKAKESEARQVYIGDLDA